MISVNRTASSYAALSSLRKIADDLQTSQDRISTGLKVRTAADNATAFAAAQSLRADIKVHEGFQANMTLVKARADVAATAVDKVLDILQKMKDAVGKAANTDATANGAVQTELAAYKTQLLAAVKSANFNGTNLLTGAGTAVNVAIGKDGSSDVNLTLAAFTTVINSATPGTTYATTLNAANTAYGSVYAMTTFDGTTTTGNISTATATITTAMTTLTTLRNDLGAFSSALDSQADFMQQMSDIRKSVLSDLVDADMSEESAKVQALQVKQQLAYQALSIGNSSLSNVLTLFR